MPVLERFRELSEPSTCMEGLLNLLEDSFYCKDFSTIIELPAVIAAKGLRNIELDMMNECEVSGAFEELMREIPDSREQPVNLQKLVTILVLMAEEWARTIESEGVTGSSESDELVTLLRKLPQVESLLKEAIEKFLALVGDKEHDESSKSEMMLVTAKDLEDGPDWLEAVSAVIGAGSKEELFTYFDTDGDGYWNIGEAFRALYIALQGGSSQDAPLPRRRNLERAHLISKGEEPPLNDFGLPDVYKFLMWMMDKSTAMEAFLDLLEHYGLVKDFSIPVSVPTEVAVDAFQRMLSDMLSVFGIESDASAVAKLVLKLGEGPWDVGQIIAAIDETVEMAGSAMNGRDSNSLMSANGLHACYVLMQMESDKNILGLLNGVFEDITELGKLTQAANKWFSPVWLFAIKDLQQPPRWMCIVAEVLEFERILDFLDRFDLDGDGYLNVGEIYPAMCIFLHEEGKMEDSKALKPKPRTVEAGLERIKAHNDAFESLPPAQKFFYQLSDPKTALEALLDKMEEWGVYKDISVAFSTPVEACIDPFAQLAQQLLEECHQDRDLLADMFNVPEDHRKELADYNIMTKVLKMMVEKVSGIIDSSDKRNRVFISVLDRFSEEDNALTILSDALDAFSEVAAGCANENGWDKSVWLLNTKGLEDGFRWLGPVAKALKFQSEEDFFQQFDVDGDGYLTVAEAYPIYIKYKELRGVIFDDKAATPRKRELKAGFELIGQ